LSNTQKATARLKSSHKQRSILLNSYSQSIFVINSKYSVNIYFWPFPKLAFYIFFHHTDLHLRIGSVTIHPIDHHLNGVQEMGLEVISYFAF